MTPPTSAFGGCFDFLRSGLQRKATAWLCALAFVLSGLLQQTHAQTFSNTNPIQLPNSMFTQGPGSPYPSPIVVSGVGSSLTSLTITLSNLSHAYADDIDVLLIGPNGLNVMLMSDCGGLNPVSSLTLVFSASGGISLSDTATLTSGTFLPTNFDAPGDVDGFPAPAPLVGPYGSSLSAFNGTNPNGIWSLYVLDDTQGNDGTIAGGWSLTVATVPEPSSFLLGASGLGLLLGFATYRRVQRSRS